MKDDDVQSVLNAEPGDPTAPSVDRLIARLESAARGNQELDIEIARALGWTCLAEDQDNDACRFAVKNAHDTGDWRGIHWTDENGRPRGDCIQWAFTTSLDLALTLVPEGMAVDLHIGPRAIYSQASVYTRVQWFDEQQRRCTRYDPIGIAGKPKDGKLSRNTPALVVCIAALKARQAVPQTGPVSDRTAE